MHVAQKYGSIRQALLIESPHPQLLQQLLLRAAFDFDRLLT
jgi:hypothetical protein